MEYFKSKGIEQLPHSRKDSQRLSTSLNKYLNLTPTKQLLNPKIRYSTKNLLKPLTNLNTRKNSAADLSNKFLLNTHSKSFSNIPSGLDTFKLLYNIKCKDPHFTIPVAYSAIFHCGFDKIMIADSNNCLRFVKCYDVVDAIDSLRKNFEMNNCKNTENPLFILKYRNSKSLKFSFNKLADNFPELKSDLIIQKFIMPKGLRVSKHRVIINKFQKILIFSNKARTDCKEDLKKSSTTPKKEKNYEECLKTTENFQKLKNKKGGWQNLKGAYCEKTEPEKNPDKISDTERFIVSKNVEKTNIFTGKNQSFSEIIKICEYLWSKIDFYYLDKSKLKELVCDFMQDEFGKWYFIKIVYGLTEMKEVRKKRIVKVNDKPKVILKTAGGMLSQCY